MVSIRASNSGGETNVPPGDQECGDICDKWRGLLRGRVPSLVCSGWGCFPATWAIRCSGMLSVVPGVECLPSRRWQRYTGSG